MDSRAKQWMVGHGIACMGCGWKESRQRTGLRARLPYPEERGGLGRR